MLCATSVPRKSSASTMERLLFFHTDAISAMKAPVFADRGQTPSGIMCGVNTAEQVILINPEILGGTPVFAGTRVPFQALLDYIEGGHPLADFLEDFPSVTRAQAVA